MKYLITDKKEVEDIHGARETCNKIKGRILGLEEGIYVYVEILAKV